MRAVTATERHREDHTRRFAPFREILVHAIGWVGIALLGACSPRVAVAPMGPLATSDYVEVPFSPRPPPVEIVPPCPSSEAVWMDGTWQWRGGRYAWKGGAWVIPPPGARYARWALVRRSSDGHLFFASSRWKDAAGRTLADTKFVGALGPAARARSRLGSLAAPEESRENGAPRKVTDDVTVDTGDTSDTEQ